MRLGNVWIEGIDSIDRSSCHLLPSYRRSWYSCARACSPGAFGDRFRACKSNSLEKPTRMVKQRFSTADLAAEWELCVVNYTACA